MAVHRIQGSNAAHAKREMRTTPIHLGCLASFLSYRPPDMEVTSSLVGGENRIRALNNTNPANGRTSPTRWPPRILASASLRTPDSSQNPPGQDPCLLNS